MLPRRLRARRFALVLMILIPSLPLAPDTPAPAPGNAILIEDVRQARNADLDRRPITISRVFAKGEFPNCVQAVVRDTPVPTQCDVMSRWPDGSVQHALLSFWAEIRKNQGAQVDFIGQASPPSGEPLWKWDMISILDRFSDASMEVSATGGAEGSETTNIVSARQILAEWDEKETDWNVRYRLRGPIATQIIVEDRSPSLAYDFGWRATLKSAQLGAALTQKDRVIRIRSADAEAAAAWQFPMVVAVDAEQIRVCGLEGSELAICPNGRGVNGTVAVDHPPSTPTRMVIPDQGWQPADDDKYKSLHPAFVLTFYPGWEGVKVEWILENVWTTRLQDQVYNVRLRLRGHPAEPVWSGGVNHIASTRWRKVFWAGQEPPETRIDHNLPYLAYTGVIPNFDLTIKVNPAAVQAEARSFLNSNSEVMGNAQWLKAFPSPGGRGDIAILPRWYALYLYTFDRTLYSALIGNGEASGHVPIHYRESLGAGKQFSAEHTAEAFGRPLSIDARPTARLMLGQLTSGDVRPPDRIVPVGAATQGGWAVEQAHQPSMVYLPYLITGDWYFLEELYFWSSFNLAFGNPGICNFCRFADVGYIHGGTEPRAEAWALRTLAHTALAAPDGSVEKIYFTKKLENNIAVKEGKFNITNGFFHEPAEGCAAPCRSTLWRIGRDYIAQGFSNPLRFPELGGSGANLDRTVDKESVYAVGSPWQSNFLQLVLGHIDDMGFAKITPLRQYLAVNLIQQLQHPEFNPYLAGEYRIPIRRLPDQAFYDSWAEVRKGYTASLRDVAEFPVGRLAAPDHYPFILRAAASHLPGLVDENGFTGEAAFEWIDKKINKEPFRSNPAWAFVPRRSGVAVASDRKPPNPSWYRMPKASQQK